MCIVFSVQCVQVSYHSFFFVLRTFTTKTKKPGAEIVGAIPRGEEEEDREGREQNLEEFTEEDQNLQGFEDDDGDDDEILLRRLEKLREDIYTSLGRKKKTKTKPDRKKTKKIADLLRKLLLD